MKIIILNQQKNKYWLKKLVNIIKKNDPKNKIIHLEKIREIDIIKNNCELLISFHNGQIIKPKIINLLKGYCINFHNSLLPKNRGWAPILWTAYNNNQFATTIHKISDGLDTGDICAQKIIKKSLKKYSLEDVYHLLEKESLILFKKIFYKIKREIITKKKVIKYKKQSIKGISYNNKSDTETLMKKLPLGYNTKINEINLLSLKNQLKKITYK